MVLGPEGPVTNLDCGATYDWSTGLIFKQGRYFDPNTGIWITLGSVMVCHRQPTRLSRRQRKYTRRERWLILLLLLLVILFLTGCNTPEPNIPSPNPSPTPCPPAVTPLPSPVVTSAPSLTSTSEPTDTPEPTWTPQPTNTVDPLAKTAYITIDDGPDASYTNQVLDVLAKHQVKATFFLVGNRIETYPDQVIRMKAEQHALGNHSYSHPLQWELLSTEDQTLEIRRTEDAFFTAIGERTNLFRAPGGAVTTANLTDYYVYGWTVDTYDFEYSANTPGNAETVANNALIGNFDPNFRTENDRLYTQNISIDTAQWRRPIILIHSVHPVDPDALDKLITGLKQRGYSFGTLPRPGDRMGVTITNGN